MVLRLIVFCLFLTRSEEEKEEKLEQEPGQEGEPGGDPQSCAHLQGGELLHCVSQACTQKGFVVSNQGKCKREREAAEADVQSAEAVDTSA